MHTDTFSTSPAAVHSENGSSHRFIFLTLLTWKLGQGMGDLWIENWSSATNSPSVADARFLAFLSLDVRGGMRETIAWNFVTLS